MINVPDKDAGERHRLLTRLVRLRGHNSANAICHLADSICYFGAVRQSLRRNPQGMASGEFLQKIYVEYDKSICQSPHGW
jgi:hypothetical protein